jgi:hypothetical protein
MLVVVVVVIEVVVVVEVLFGGGELAEDIESVDGDAAVEVGALVELQLELAHALGLALEGVREEVKESTTHEQ